MFLFSYNKNLRSTRILFRFIVGMTYTVVFTFHSLLINTQVAGIQLTIKMKTYIVKFYIHKLGVFYKFKLKIYGILITTHFNSDIYFFNLKITYLFELFKYLKPNYSLLISLTTTFETYLAYNEINNSIVLNNIAVLDSD